MSYELEPIENFASDALPVPGIGALLCFEATDSAVVEPPSGDGGHQRRRIPGCCADRAFDCFDEFLWRDDESETQTGSNTLRYCGDVQCRLRRQRCQRGWWVLCEISV